MAPTTLTDLSAPTRTTTLDIGVDLDGVCYSFDEALARWIAANTDHPADKLVPVDRWNTWECWDTDIDTWLGWFAAGTLMALLTSHKQLVETCDLECRLTALEQKQ